MKSGSSLAPRLAREVPCCVTMCYLGRALRWNYRAGFVFGMMIVIASGTGGGSGS